MIDAFLLILELVANMFQKCWATCCENVANKLKKQNVVSQIHAGCISNTCFKPVSDTSVTVAYDLRESCNKF